MELQSKCILNLNNVLLHKKLNHKLIILHYIYKLPTIKQVLVTLEYYWSLGFSHGDV